MAHRTEEPQTPGDKPKEVFRWLVKIGAKLPIVKCKRCGLEVELPPADEPGQFKLEPAEGWIFNHDGENHLICPECWTNAES